MMYTSLLKDSQHLQEFNKLSSTESEHKYLVEYKKTKKEFEKLIDKKINSFYKDMKEKQQQFEYLNKVQESNFNENQRLFQNILELEKNIKETDMEIETLSKKNIENYEKLVEKRKENSLNFEVKISEISKSSLINDALRKEVNLYMNFLRFRVINLDEINNSGIVKAYFINFEKVNAKYFEVNLLENSHERTQKFWKSIDEELMNDVSNDK